MFKSKIILTLFSLFCFGVFFVTSGSVMAADMKIGVMNVQKVLTSSVAGKAAKVKFDAKMKELQDKFKVEEEDLLAIVASGDLNDLDFSGDPTSQAAQKLGGVIALQMAKKVTTDQLEKAMTILSEDKPGTTVSRSSMGGITAVQMSGAQPDEPTTYATVAQDGTTVLIAFEQKALLSAVARAASGQTEKLSPQLSAVARALPKGSQFKLAISLPDAARSKIQESITALEAQAKTAPQMGMQLGFIQPLKNIQSLLIGVKMDDEIELALASDLGDGQAAMAAMTLLQSMALPMMKGWIAQRVGDPQSRAAQSLNVSADGSTLTLGLTMGSKEIGALMQAGAAAQMMAPAMGGADVLAPPME